MKENGTKICAKEKAVCTGIPLTKYTLVSGYLVTSMERESIFGSLNQEMIHR